MYLNTCKMCGRIKKRNQNCCKNKKVYNQTKYDLFRNTKKWQRKREEIKERDRYTCSICNLSKNKYNYEKLEVHHIDKLCENWEARLNNDNLITLCVYHHKLADKGRITKELLKQLVKKSTKNFEETILNW